MADAAKQTLLGRLQTEREEAYRRYNETLTALDLALQARPAEHRWSSREPDCPAARPPASP